VKIFTDRRVVTTRLDRPGTPRNAHGHPAGTRRQSIHAETAVAGIFGCSDAGVNTLGDTAAEPVTEGELLLDVPAAPGRSGCNAGAAQFI
jgi:hypothetical protein